MLSLTQIMSNSTLNLLKNGLQFIYDKICNFGWGTKTEKTSSLTNMDFPESLKTIGKF